MAMMGGSGAVLGRVIVQFFAQTSQFDEALGHATTGISKFTMTMAKAGVGLSSLGYIGGQFFNSLVRPMQASIKGAMEFQTSLNEIQTIMETGMRANRDYTKGLLQLTRNYGIEMKKATEALYWAISAGIPEPEALNVLEHAAKMARVGVTDLDTALEAIRITTNSYNITLGKSSDALGGLADSSKQLDKITRTLFEGVNYGSFRMNDLVGVIGKVAPTARLAGVSLDELVSAMAAATRNGLDLRSAGVGITNFLLSFLRPTDNAVKKVDELNRALGLTGKNAFELSASFLKEHGLMGTFQKLKDLVGDDVGALAEIIRRQRGMRLAASLLVDDLRNFENALRDTQKAVGGLDEHFKTMSDTTLELQRTFAQFQSASLQLGSKQLPILDRALEKVNARLEEMNKWMEERPLTTWFGSTAFAGLVLFGKGLSDVAIKLGMLAFAVAILGPKLTGFFIHSPIAFAKGLYQSSSAVKFLTEHIRILGNTIRTYAPMLSGKFLHGGIMGMAYGEYTAIDPMLKKFSQMQQMALKARKAFDVRASQGILTQYIAGQARMSQARAMAQSVMVQEQGIVKNMAGLLRTLTNSLKSTSQAVANIGKNWTAFTKIYDSGAASILGRITKMEAAFQKFSTTFNKLWVRLSGGGISGTRSSLKALGDFSNAYRALIKSIQTPAGFEKVLARFIDSLNKAGVRGTEAKRAITAFTDALNKLRAVAATVDPMKMMRATPQQLKQIFADLRTALAELRRASDVSTLVAGINKGMAGIANAYAGYQKHATAAITAVHTRMQQARVGMLQAEATYKTVVANMGAHTTAAKDALTKLKAAQDAFIQSQHAARRALIQSLGQAGKTVLDFERGLVSQTGLHGIRRLLLGLPDSIQIALQRIRGLFTGFSKVFTIGAPITNQTMAYIRDIEQVLKSLIATLQKFHLEGTLLGKTVTRISQEFGKLSASVTKSWAGQVGGGVHQAKVTAQQVQALTAIRNEFRLLYNLFITDVASMGLFKNLGAYIKHLFTLKGALQGAKIGLALFTTLLRNIGNLMISLGKDTAVFSIIITGFSSLYDVFREMIGLTKDLSDLEAQNNRLADSMMRVAKAGMAMGADISPSDVEAIPGKYQQLFQLQAKEVALISEAVGKAQFGSVSGFAKGFASWYNNITMKLVQAVDWATFGLLDKAVDLTSSLTGINNLEQDYAYRMKIIADMNFALEEQGLNMDDGALRKQLEATKAQVRAIEAEFTDIFKKAREAQVNEAARTYAQLLRIIPESTSLAMKDASDEFRSGYDDLYMEFLRQTDASRDAFAYALAKTRGGAYDNPLARLQEMINLTKALEGQDITGLQMQMELDWEKNIGDPRTLEGVAQILDKMGKADVPMDRIQEILEFAQKTGSTIRLAERSVAMLSSLKEMGGFSFPAEEVEKYMQLIAQGTIRTPEDAAKHIMSLTDMGLDSLDELADAEGAYTDTVADGVSTRINLRKQEYSEQIKSTTDSINRILALMKMLGEKETESLQAQMEARKALRAAARQARDAETEDEKQEALDAAQVASRAWSKATDARYALQEARKEAGELLKENVKGVTNVSDEIENASERIVSAVDTFASKARTIFRDLVKLEDFNSFFQTLTAGFEAGLNNVDPTIRELIQLRAPGWFTGLDENIYQAMAKMNTEGLKKLAEDLPRIIGESKTAEEFKNGLVEAIEKCGGDVQAATETTVNTAVESAAESIKTSTQGAVEGALIEGTTAAIPAAIAAGESVGEAYGKGFWARAWAWIKGVWETGETGTLEAQDYKRQHDYLADSGTLDRFDSYAKGGTHKGGLALVGEEGPEIVHMPRGTSVFSNKDSEALATLLGRLGIPAYAAGTDDTKYRTIAEQLGKSADVWGAGLNFYDIFENQEKVIQDFIEQGPMSAKWQGLQNWRRELFNAFYGTSRDKWTQDAGVLSAQYRNAMSEYQKDVMKDRSIKGHLDRYWPPDKAAALQLAMQNVEGWDMLHGQLREFSSWPMPDGSRQPKSTASGLPYYAHYAFVAPLSEDPEGWAFYSMFNQIPENAQKAWETIKQGPSGAFRDMLREDVVKPLLGGKAPDPSTWSDEELLNYAYNSGMVWNTPPEFSSRDYIVWAVRDHLRQTGKLGEPGRGAQWDAASLRDDGTWDTPPFANAGVPGYGEWYDDAFGGDWFGFDDGRDAYPSRGSRLKEERDRRGLSKRPAGLREKGEKTRKRLKTRSGITPSRGDFLLSLAESISYLPGDFRTSGSSRPVSLFIGDPRAIQKRFFTGGVGVHGGGHIAQAIASYDSASALAKQFGFSVESLPYGLREEFGMFSGPEAILSKPTGMSDSQVIAFHKQKMAFWESMAKGIRELTDYLYNRRKITYLTRRDMGLLTPANVSISHGTGADKYDLRDVATKEAVANLVDDADLTGLGDHPFDDGEISAKDLESLLGSDSTDNDFDDEVDFEFARGGKVPRRGVALVGEEGPELVELPEGATVHDAGKTRGMLGDVNIPIPGMESPESGSFKNKSDYFLPGEEERRRLLESNIVGMLKTATPLQRERFLDTILGASAASKVLESAEYKKNPIGVIWGAVRGMSVDELQRAGNALRSIRAGGVVEEWKGRAPSSGGGPLPDFGSDQDIPEIEDDVFSSSFGSDDSDSQHLGKVMSGATGLMVPPTPKQKPQPVGESEGQYLKNKFEQKVRSASIEKQQAFLALLIGKDNLRALIADKEFTRSELADYILNEVVPRYGYSPERLLSVWEQAGTMSGKSGILDGSKLGKPLPDFEPDTSVPPDRIPMLGKISATSRGTVGLMVPPVPPAPPQVTGETEEDFKRRKFEDEIKGASIEQLEAFMRAIIGPDETDRIMNFQEWDAGSLANYVLDTVIPNSKYPFKTLLSRWERVKRGVGGRGDQENEKLTKPMPDIPELPPDAIPTKNTAGIMRAIQGAMPSFDMFSAAESASLRSSMSEGLLSGVGGSGAGGVVMNFNVGSVRTDEDIERIAMTAQARLERTLRRV